MNDWEISDEYLLDCLKERAKELNCLYQVDEILNNSRLSLSDIFKEVTRVIPSGWQFPELCKARIIYDNCSYQTPGFHTSPFFDSHAIKIDGKLIGKIEVFYITRVVRSPEGYFLEKEHKLLKTIADRIAQIILQRHMEQVLREWNTKHGASKNNGTYKEWMVIVDLLQRTDQNMLLNICKKMINHLCWSGIKEAEEVLWNFGSTSGSFFKPNEYNYPSKKLPPSNLAKISENTFRIAAHHLSDDEISMRLQKWIQEEKAYSLIKVIGCIDTSLQEIVKVITRYKNVSGESSVFYSPREHWLVVALIQRFLSDNMEFIAIARPHLESINFYHIVNRLIFPDASHGKIGGKSTGLFFAEQVLKKASGDHPLLHSVKVPKTWYITTDEIKDFLHYNSLEELNVQKYKDLYEIRMDYPNVIQMMKNSEFPEGIIKSLAMVLDDFGECPIIVRSSSLLEDQMGSTFSGKYKSLFLANQGTKQERLEALMDAIVEVYASMYSPDSIQYRSERNLLDFHEEMGIMIQEVVGTKIGHYFFPLFAGVIFSNNEFRWAPRVKREDGLIRMVMGLGTRAVDRVSDDFPVLVSPGQPGLRVNTVPDEIRRYSPKNIDVINLKKNIFETVDISSLIKEYGHLIPKLHQIVSIYEQDYIKKPLAFDINLQKDDLLVTFDGLIKDTSFLKQANLIQKILKETMQTPVDIEFASDGEFFYLLQCCPQSFGTDNVPAPIPKDISPKDILFSANRYISNAQIIDISHIVYVDPEGYNRLNRLEDLMQVGKAIGILNSLLPKKRFILMGPGRWGSRGDIKMGVHVSYADINNTAALIEIARKKSNYVPELSFGTHFFQDLVESNIRYLPLYPDDKKVIFNETFLTKSKNIFSQILPDYDHLSDVVRVIDLAATNTGKMLRISMNAELEEAIGYLASSFNKAEEPYSEELTTKLDTKQQYTPYVDDRFWRWRHYMAERIADSIDLEKFGIAGIYLFGSTNNGTAGPGSDIDLLIHFQGSPEQRKALMNYLEGWSLSLAEMNYLRTGYASEGLLDIHLVTDEDIRNKSAFALKIGSITDPAHPLKVIN